MKKLIWLFLLILPLSLFSFKVTEHGHYRIKLVEYDLIFVPDKCQSVITKVDKKRGRYYKLRLRDCKGAMLFESYDLIDSTLKEKGNYIASLDLLKSYVYAVNATTGKSEVKVSKYYQPLKDGIWNIYNNDGSIAVKKTYNQGVMISKD